MCVNTVAIIMMIIIIKNKLTVVMFNITVLQWHFTMSQVFMYACK